jgi:hypothetical protein
MASTRVIADAVSTGRVRPLIAEFVYSDCESRKRRPGVVRTEAGLILMASFEARGCGAIQVDGRDLPSYR